MHPGGAAQAQDDQLGRTPGNTEYQDCLARNGRESGALMVGRRLRGGRSCKAAAGDPRSAPVHAVVKSPAPHQGADKAKWNYNAGLISPPAGSVRAIAILIGTVAPGHRTGLRTAGTCPWSREHLPSEILQPSAPGPVCMESDPACWKPCLHGTRWPGAEPAAVVGAWAGAAGRLRDVIPSTVDQTFVAGLHPVPIGPDVPLAAPIS